MPPGSQTKKVAPTVLLNAVSNLRYNKNSKRYRVPGFSSNLGSNLLFYNKTRTGTAKKQNTTTPLVSAITFSAPSSIEVAKPTYQNPLGYRKYTNPASGSQSVLPSLLQSLQKAAKISGLGVVSNYTKIHLTPDQHSKLKEIVLQRAHLAQFWNNFTREDIGIDKCYEKVIEINRAYLGKVLNEVATQIANAKQKQVKFDVGKGKDLEVLKESKQYKTVLNLKTVRSETSGSKTISQNLGVKVYKVGFLTSINNRLPHANLKQNISTARLPSEKSSEQNFSTDSVGNAQSVGTVKFELFEDIDEEAQLVSVEKEIDTKQNVRVISDIQQLSQFDSDKKASGSSSLPVYAKTESDLSNKTLISVEQREPSKSIETSSITNSHFEETKPRRRGRPRGGSRKSGKLPTGFVISTPQPSENNLKLSTVSFEEPNPSISLGGTSLDEPAEVLAVDEPPTVLETTQGRYGKTYSRRQSISKSNETVPSTENNNSVDNNNSVKLNLSPISSDGTHVFELLKNNSELSTKTVSEKQFSFSASADSQSLCDTGKTPSVIELETPESTNQNSDILCTISVSKTSADPIGSYSSPILAETDADMEDIATLGTKERNLRRLLEAFPGADIMEAQDILSRCDWNYHKALTAAQDFPLNSKRKMSAGSSQNEILILSSSDEDVSARPKSRPAPVGVPTAKRRKISSSGSDTDTPQSFTLNSGLSVKPVQISSSLSIKPVPAPPNNNTETLKSPFFHNLPKGIVVVNVSEKKTESPRAVNGNTKVTEIVKEPVPLSQNASHKPDQVVKTLLTNASSKNPIPDNNIKPKPSSSTLKKSPPKRRPFVRQRKSKKPLGDFGDEPKSKKSKKRLKYTPDDDEDEDYGDELVYDSDDSDNGENFSAAHSAVLKYFEESSPEELGCIPGCSKKKAEAIINLRPYANWADLVEKLASDRTLSTDYLNGAQKVLDMRTAINKLMTKCQQISFDMEDLVEDLKTNRENNSDYVNKQPDLLNNRLHLAPYQMLGLNWLILMHNQQVNGILADEMGLGKTIQAIAFLTYLRETGTTGPHLIVVPSSTLDNWQNELLKWWPTVCVLCYHGNQENRRELRMQILNDEVDEFDIMITTYNMVASSAEDRGFFKRLDFDYVIFDEAHMLKNMGSQRYQHLMRIKAPRRLLLTGTPLQNNLVELMSLLIFAMPHMFSGKTEHIRKMFSVVSKDESNKSSYEKDRIEHAKLIMKPFVLRRLKKEVLQDLPPKHDEIQHIPMTETQQKAYDELVATLSEEVRKNEENTRGAGMMMQLRRAANHPLLLRTLYDDVKLKKMAKDIQKEPTHAQSNLVYVFEDMAVMSDFELHKLCKQYKSLNKYCLQDEDICNSGKFKVLDDRLQSLIEQDHRILLFSQFTMVLDVLEEFLKIRSLKFLRLDGQIPVSERQDLIDEFNKNSDIPIFLLSTRAGGLGINLTAADTVILHDIDFNPYNDKQAEDRCHRVGQVKDVNVYRFVSKGTIEEGILQRATEKLKLERDIHEEGATDDDNEETDTANVAKLLRDALGIKSTKD